MYCTLLLIKVMGTLRKRKRKFHQELGEEVTLQGRSRWLGNVCVDEVVRARLPGRGPEGKL